MSGGPSQSDWSRGERMLVMNGSLVLTQADGRRACVGVGGVSPSFPR